MAYVEITPDQRWWLDLTNFSTVNHTNNTGYVGRYSRAPGNGYTDETFLKFDTSDLLFSTVTNVDLEWVSGLAGSQTGSTTMSLFDQDKSNYASILPNIYFDDFAQTAWATTLATLSIYLTGTYNVLNTAQFLAWLQAAINFQKDDNGLIMGCNWGSTIYYLRVDSAKLKITYTPPTNTPWGCKYIVDQDVALTTAKLMGGTSPNVDYMKIKSISIPVGDNKSENIRLGVYTGGALDDPEGASLLWDAGQISGSGANKWYTITHPSGGVSWPKNTITWLAYKANGGTTDTIYTTLSSKSGDTQSARGRFSSTGMSADETASFESSVPSGGSFSSDWQPIVVQYAIEPPTGKPSNRGLMRGIYRGVNRGIL